MDYPFKTWYPFASPDDRISLCVMGGASGLKTWNNTIDSMTLKIAGGKTLAECVVEETEDYIIYSDGQKVVINKYVPGTYDLYLERLKEAEGNSQLYGLTEPTIDHAKMLNDINDEQLEKLAQSPMILPDSETPVQLTPRTIPIPIDFCCRVDKKTQEIYIGEGYENLLSNTVGAYNKTSNIDFISYDNNEVIVKVNASDVSEKFIAVKGNISVADSTVCTNYEVLTTDLFKTRSGTINGEGNRDSVKGWFTSVCTGLSSSLFHFFLKESTTENSIFKVKMQVTKTSTPKPFVKSIMPSGKMSILTNATTSTHTFIAKGVGATYTANGSEISLNGNEKLIQFLAYKGLLTQEQIQAETDKKIELK